MTATFQLKDLHEPVLVIVPETHLEAILLASFIRYDANAFHLARVERSDDSEDGEVTLIAFAADHGE